MKFDYINVKTPDIKAVEYQNLNEYYLKKYFKFQNEKGDVFFAVCEDCEFRKKAFNKQKTFLVKQDDFIEILERDFSQDNTNWAINHLKNTSPNSSAKNISYTKALAGFSIIFIGFLGLFINFFNILNNAAYLVQNILKTILFNRSLIVSEKSQLASISDDLPIYTILIPLYKEEFKVKAIL